MAVVGYMIGKEILAALRLSDHEVQRIVIDIPCDDVVKVYVQKFMRNSEVSDVAAALASTEGDVDVVECEAPLVVDEKGNIRVGIDKDGFAQWELPKQV